jgi:putative YhdH/YhfP family quinone oxidoreductase
VAVALLAKAGFDIVASTGKAEAGDFLKQLGAKSVISRDEVNDRGPKPLLGERWAGAVDTVGGNTLGTILRAAKRRGVITACGLVGGAELNLTVFPFILRAVELVGIDSVECPAVERVTLWQRLATDWKPKQLATIATREITLDGLATELKRINEGGNLGRTLVRLTS